MGPIRMVTRFWYRELGSVLVGLDGWRLWVQRTYKKRFAAEGLFSDIVISASDVSFWSLDRECSR